MSITTWLSCIKGRWGPVVAGTRTSQIGDKICRRGLCETTVGLTLELNCWLEACRSLSLETRALLGSTHGDIGISAVLDGCESLLSRLRSLSITGHELRRTYSHTALITIVLHRVVVIVWVITVSTVAIEN